LTGVARGLLLLGCGDREWCTVGVENWGVPVEPGLDE